MADEAGGVTPLERAVFSLQDKLQEASLLEGRPGAIAALLAIAEFLSSISSPGDLRHQQSINSLISALMSLDDGGVLPLLKPAHRSGRSRNSIAKESHIGLAAAIVKRLCESGLAFDKAYAKVALVCRKAGMKAGRKGAPGQTGEVTARTVRGWCEGIEADVGRHSRAAKIFDLHMSMAGHLAAQDAEPEIACRELLENLHRYLADTNVASH